jgi:hypothetical protein
MHIHNEFTLLFCVRVFRELLYIQFLKWFHARLFEYFTWHCWSNPRYCTLDLYFLMGLLHETSIVLIAWLDMSISVVYTEYVYCLCAMFIYSTTGSSLILVIILLCVILVYIQNLLENPAITRDVF